MKTNKDFIDGIYEKAKKYEKISEKPHICSIKLKCIYSVAACAFCLFLIGGSFLLGRDTVSKTSKNKDEHNPMNVSIDSRIVEKLSIQGTVSSVTKENGNFVVEIKNEEGKYFKIAYVSAEIRCKKNQKMILVVEKENSESDVDFVLRNCESDMYIYSEKDGIYVNTYNESPAEKK